LGSAKIHDFPDGESLIQITTEVKHKIAILISSLDNPNPKIIPLIFMTQTHTKIFLKRKTLNAKNRARVLVLAKIY
jgi:ribose-phosphate pyrophosphokinase